MWVVQSWEIFRQGCSGMDSPAFNKSRLYGGTPPSLFVAIAMISTGTRLRDDGEPKLTAATWVSLTE